MRGESPRGAVVGAVDVRTEFKSVSGEPWF